MSMEPRAPTRLARRLGTFDAVVIVRDLDVASNQVTGETVLSFARSTGNSGRLRKPG